MQKEVTPLSKLDFEREAMDQAKQLGLSYDRSRLETDYRSYVSIVPIMNSAEIVVERSDRGQLELNVRRRMSEGPTL